MENKQLLLNDLKQYIDKVNFELNSFIVDVGWEHDRSNLDTQPKQSSAMNEVTKNMFSLEPCLPLAIPNNIIKDQRSIVTIDENLQEKILQSQHNLGEYKNRRVPESSGELCSNFTSKERLALYNYTIQHTVGPQKPPELHIDELDSTTTNEHTAHLSKIELEKRERDMKRRRISHRAKVSTKNKSHVEVTREMINNMMQVLGFQSSTLTSSDSHTSTLIEQDKTEITGNSSHDYQNCTPRRYKNKYPKSRTDDRNKYSDRPRSLKSRRS